MHIHKHTSSSGQKAQSCEYKNSAEKQKNLSIENNRKKFKSFNERRKITDEITDFEHSTCSALFL